MDVIIVDDAYLPGHRNRSAELLEQARDRFHYAELFDGRDDQGNKLHNAPVATQRYLEPKIRNPERTAIVLDLQIHDDLGYGLKILNQLDAATPAKLPTIIVVYSMHVENDPTDVDIRRNLRAIEMNWGVPRTQMFNRHRTPNRVVIDTLAELGQQYGIYP